MSFSNIELMHKYESKYVKVAEARLSLFTGSWFQLLMQRLLATILSNL